jgi:xanthine/uracil permease
MGLRTLLTYGLSMSIATLVAILITNVLFDGEIFLIAIIGAMSTGWVSARYGLKLKNQR